MKIQLNIKALLVILSLLAGLFFLGRHIGIKQKESAVKGLSEALESVSETKRSYEITIDSLTHHVRQINNVIVADKALINTLENEKERLEALHMKDVKVIAKLNSSIEVLNKELSSFEPLVITYSGCDTFDIGSWLRLPVKLSYEDRFAYNRISIDTSGHSLTDFGLYDSEINLIIGTQKKSVFNNKSSVTTVSTVNPYLNISPEQVILVQPKPKFYERNSFWLGVGFAGGFVANYF